MTNSAVTATRDMDAPTSQGSRANTIANIAEFAGRGFLALLFLLSGLGEIGAYIATAAYMSAVGVPVS